MSTIPGRRGIEHQRRVIELRRSNATQRIPARKIRKQSTRAGQLRARLREWGLR